MCPLTRATSLSSALGLGREEESCASRDDSPSTGGLWAATSFSRFCIGVGGAGESCSVDRLSNSVTHSTAEAVK